MGIHTTISSAPSTTTEGAFDITVKVENKGGGGGTFEADVTATWNKDDLELDSAVNPSPTPTKTELGKLTWAKHVCDDDGTNFTFTMLCKGTVASPDVSAKACPEGKKVGCSDDKVTLTCSVTVAPQNQAGAAPEIPESSGGGSETSGSPEGGSETYESPEGGSTSCS